MNKPMKLTYLKISKTLYKMFYESGRAYGEFYMEIKPDTDARGVASIFMKDPDYSKFLMDGLNQALVEYTEFKKGK